ncbi:MAG: DNA polymerase/3'-5' exonuclease PolX [Phycisphaerales bacterium JB059]
MSFNDELVARFEQMAQMLELTGANPFRVNAHARAARTIDDLTSDLREIADDPKALIALPGIGKGIAEKIAEYAQTGKIQEHIDLLAEVPAGLLRVLEAPGLGPKKVALLWKELGVEDLAGLKRVIEDGSILSLPRMGQKTVDNLRSSIEFMESSGQRLHLGIAMPIAQAIVERMESVKGVKRAAFAGSVRRGRETIGDIDVLVTTSDAERAREAFTSMEGVTEVLAKGESKSSVRLSLEGIDHARWGGDGTSAQVQVDLRIVPEASWGAALLYFSGSKEHNVRLRERAQKQGLTLNEYGLYSDDGESEPPQKRGLKAKAGKTEEEIYAALGLVWVPPEIREDRGELDLDETPGLIEVSDIRAELHAHTTASDGVMSLGELVGEAKRRKFHTIAVTDHSKSSAQAGGLDEARLRAQRREIEALRETTKGIEVLCGCEVDILSDGSLDFDDDFLAELDVVVASPHVALSQEPRKATARLLKAIENPYVHVLGHPTGRLINRRKGLEPAMDEIIAAAVEHDVALEINAHWMRLDLRDTHVRAAVEAGAKIAIDCDDHAPGDFDNLVYGVLTGRRGWLTPELCVNTWSKARLRKWLRSKGRA